MRAMAIITRCRRPPEKLMRILLKALCRSRHTGDLQELDGAGRRAASRLPLRWRR